jgi:hypothetical protein
MEKKFKPAYKSVRRYWKINPRERVRESKKNYNRQAEKFNTRQIIEEDLFEDDII